MTDALREQLLFEGYYNLKEIEGRGICANQSYFFTTAIVYGIDEIGYKGRYCYESDVEAEIALKYWDGNGHPLGRWIKHKGIGIDESNPNS